MCWAAQPPQRVKSGQIAAMRDSEGAMISTSWPRSPSTTARTVSPGSV